MKKVLVITYHYPPSDGIRSIMISKMTKYLPEFGWQPIVFTSSIIRGIPATTPVEIPEDKIYRVNFRDPLYKISTKLNNLQRAATEKTSVVNSDVNLHSNNIFAYVRFFLSRNLLARRLINLILAEKPDWCLRTVRMAEKYVKDNDVDALMSSSNPPYTVNIAASMIKSRTNLPWVAEFPDLWSKNHYAPTIFFEPFIEKLVLKNVDHIVTVSEPFAQTMSDLHNKPVTVIHNGFDPDDYPDNVEMRRLRNQKLTVSYTGTVYLQQDPSPLFEALSLLKQNQTQLSNCFELNFYGSIPDRLFELVTKYKINDLVKIKGRVSLERSHQIQCSSDALLLLVWNDTSHKGVYTGKIFEYLGARRPILAVGPKGDVVDQLLQKTGTGKVVTSVSEIANLLRDWLTEWLATGQISYKADETQINYFNRRSQAHRMATILDAITFHR